MRHVPRLFPFGIPLLAATALLIFAASCATEKKESLRTRLMVTGEADSKASPDTAVIVLSVVTQNARALEAQQQNARKSDAVIQAVKQAAGANPEVKTSDYGLEPQRDWWGGMPRIKGYEARNSVTVTTDALDNVGALLDAAGKQAMAKAEAMAQAMGGRIVRVVEEREGGFPAPTPPLSEAYHNLPD